jgi:hypothetical protein
MRTFVRSKAHSLHYGGSNPDDRYPDLFRIHWPDGRISDICNLSRAKDAAMVMAEEDGRDHRLLRWTRTTDRLMACPSDPAREGRP